MRDSLGDFGRSAIRSTFIVGATLLHRVFKAFSRSSCAKVVVKSAGVCADRKFTQHSSK